MENYYKITPEQAALIGKFEYAKNQAIDPFVGEQKDGTFLVSEQVYEMLKERSELKKVDFSKLTKVPKENLDTKESTI